MIARSAPTPPDGETHHIRKKTYRFPWERISTECLACPPAALRAQGRQPAEQRRAGVAPGRIRPSCRTNKIGGFQSLTGEYGGTYGLARDARSGFAAGHNRLGTVWLLDPDGARTHRVIAHRGHGRKITDWPTADPAKRREA